MTNIITPSITKEVKRTYPLYTPSNKEKDVIESVFFKFRTTADLRDQPLVNFDGLNIIRYIEDSYRSYVTNIDVRDNIEDWQSIIHDQFTRNKVNAVLAKVVAVLPIAEAIPRGDEDVRRAQIVNNIYEYAEELDDYELFMVNYLLEAIVKGTAIGYEGHNYKEQKIRSIVKGDGDTMQIIEEIKKTNSLHAEVVRLEDFYPSSLAVSSIKQMPFCFWRNVMNFSVFQQNYTNFEKAKFVLPKVSSDENAVEVPYYLDYISNDINTGEVEVIKYYNKETDEYIIIANGVWLNPVGIKNGETEEEIISPLPFNHKELPFFDTKFELFSADFFYGKSLPDKLKTYQSVLNVLTNMLLDQSFMTVFKPMLTNGFDSIEDDYLRPGRRTPVDTQGLPLRDAVMEIDMSTPTGWHQFILNYTRGVMEEASVDRVSQGVAGGGDRTTAQEIRIAAEGVASMLGLFGRFVKGAIKRKAYLKIKNALQFWTDPKSPIVAGILGANSDTLFNKAFSVIKLDGVTLSDGKRGTKIIALYENEEERPTAKDLETKSEISSVSSGKKVEYLAVTASYIRDLDFDIKLVINQKQESSREIDKVMTIEKTRAYLEMFPELANKTELAAAMAEKFGDDPTKVLNLEQQNQTQTPTQNQTGGSAVINNTMESATGRNSTNDLQKLQAEMLG